MLKGKSSTWKVVIGGRLVLVMHGAYPLVCIRMTSGKQRLRERRYGVLVVTVNSDAHSLERAARVLNMLESGIRESGRCCEGRC